MKDLSETVDVLNKRTESLIGSLRSARERVVSLEAEKEKLRLKVVEAGESFNSLKEENKVLKMAAAIKGDDEVVSETKRKISQMVREIDRCIAKLND